MSRQSDSPLGRLDAYQSVLFAEHTHANMSDVHKTIVQTVEHKVQTFTCVVHVSYQCMDLCKMNCVVKISISNPMKNPNLNDI